MVLEVLPDRRQVDLRLDVGLGELRRVAHAGEHQDLGRADRARGEDDLLARAGGREGGAPGEPDAGRSSALDLEADRRGAGGHGQVRPRHRSAQERVRGAPAAALARRRLDQAGSLRRAVVVVGVEREAVRASGADHQVGELAGAARRRDVERPADGVRRRGARYVVLGAHEVGEHVVPAPALASGVVAPAVVVVPVAPHVEHRVHRARSAQRLAARHVDLAVLAAGLGPRRVVPVELGLELLRERGGDLDLRRAVLAARLDEQDLRSLRAEPVGEDAAGRAGPDDHVVVVTQGTPPV